MHKLWSFGCSHSAGDELGKYDGEKLKKWYIEHTGFNNFYDFQNSHGDSLVGLTNVFEQWQQSSLFSNDYRAGYAYKLAELINYEFRSLAVSACGIDRCLYQLEKNVSNIDWNTDLVLFELPPVDRYMWNENVDQDNVMVKKHYKIENMRLIPSQTTLEYLYFGILDKVITKWPGIKIIDIIDPYFRSSYIKIKPYCLNKTNLHDFTYNLFGKYGRYPGGHFIDPAQLEFAKYLKSLL